MVQIQIDMSKRQSKILDHVKLNNDLATKKDALLYIINYFEACCK